MNDDGPKNLVTKWCGDCDCSRVDYLMVGPTPQPITTTSTYCSKQFFVLILGPYHLLYLQKFSLHDAHNKLSGYVSCLHLSSYNL